MRNFSKSFGSILSMRNLIKRANISVSQADVAMKTLEKRALFLERNLARKDKELREHLQHRDKLLKEKQSLFLEKEQLAARVDKADSDAACQMEENHRLRLRIEELQEKLGTDEAPGSAILEALERGRAEKAEQLVDQLTDYCERKIEESFADCLRRVQEQYKDLDLSMISCAPEDDDDDETATEQLVPEEQGVSRLTDEVPPIADPDTAANSALDQENPPADE